MTTTLTQEQKLQQFEAELKRLRDQSEASIDLPQNPDETPITKKKRAGRPAKALKSISFKFTLPDDPKLHAEVIYRSEKDGITKEQAGREITLEKIKPRKR